MNVFDIGETFSGLELFGYSTFPANKSHYFQPLPFQVYQVLIRKSPESRHSDFAFN